MARIDLLTAQMRQRAIKRVSLQSDEKMQLFGANDELLGSGAALPAQAIQEILTEVAPTPLNGAPLAFPYRGRDGEFEISVAPQGRGFEIRVVSFAPADSQPLQTHSVPQVQSVVPEPAPAIAPSNDDWYYMAGDQQIGPYTSAQIKALVRAGGIRRDVYLWREGMNEWQLVGQSEFKALLPALPNPRGDAENIWYYRSMTGQPVPVDKGVLVEKFRSGELTPDAWVWYNGMPDWASASATELASAIAARPMGMAPVGAGVAPIAPPTGAPRTLPGTGAYDIYGGGDPENTSGGGTNAVVPRSARGYFNVGAFLFPVFWCRAMNMDSWATGIFVLNIASRFVPLVGIAKIPICFYMGFMGNSLAWNSRRFDGAEDFRRCQFLWGAISGAIWGAFLLICVGFGVWAGIQSAQTQSSFPTSSSTTFSSPSNGSD